MVNKEQEVFNQTKNQINITKVPYFNQEKILNNNTDKGTKRAALSYGEGKD